MAYNENTPADINETFSVSQPKIKENFTAIKTLIDINHGTFDAGDEGKHNFVSLPQGTVSATFPLKTETDEMAIYCKTDGTNPALFVRKHDQTVGVVTNDINFTTAGLTSPGWCKLPCGLIMKWGISGSITTGSTGTAPLVNGAGIPEIATLLSCQITITGGVSGTEGNMYMQSFNDTATHVVTIRYWKAFGGSLSRAGYYFAIGI